MVFQAHGAQLPSVSLVFFPFYGFAFEAAHDKDREEGKGEVVEGLGSFNPVAAGAVDDTEVGVLSNRNEKE